MGCCASSEEPPVLDAHRKFITTCMEQLDLHLWMLSQAEAASKKGELAGAQFDEYVKGLELLLRERQAAQAALQSQLQTIRHSITP